MQNSILCGVIFVFYCTRISKSKMASGRHVKGNRESAFMGFLVCRILLWCNFALCLRVIVSGQKFGYV